MLIAAIALIILVVGGVGTMSVVMQENAEVADEVIVVANHVNERVQEEVDVTRDSGGLKLLNAGPEIEILEYRVLGDDGTLVLSCPASLEVGTSQKEIIDGTDTELKDCWDEYDDPAELFQVVTARGKIFTLSETGGNNTTIIDNSTHTVINNTITDKSQGSGIGFGYHPQVTIYDPENSVLMWGNSTHSDAASAGPYMRVGDVEHTALVRSGDNFNALTLPPAPGEYTLSGGGLSGTNEMYGYGSDWQDRGGWLELSGGSNVGDPGTAVLRLQDYYITNELIKVSGYAPDGATVKIVSSPNDLTQRAVDNDGFVPDVVPIDSQLNYTGVGA